MTSIARGPLATPSTCNKRHLVWLWLTAHGEWANGDAFLQRGIPQREGVVSDADDVANVGAGSAG